MNSVKWDALYNFIWDDFCDWYIEMAKLPLYGDDEDEEKHAPVLAYVLTIQCV